MEAYLLQNNLIKSLINAVVILLLNALNIEFTIFLNANLNFTGLGFSYLAFYIAIMLTLLFIHELCLNVVFC